MAKFHVLIFMSATVALCSGCGGSGSGAGNSGNQATINSVSASCSPAAVQTGQTSQCTATVAGTGNYSSSVSWSVNAIAGRSSTVGTISPTGLYTAPATVPATAATVTVTASSQSNASIAGTSSISLSYPSPTIASLSPTMINAASSPTVVTVQGSNFTPASTVDLGGTPISSSFVSSTTLQATIPVSSLKLAGVAYLNVSNPAPGGGTSASAQVTVVPQILSVTPAAAPVGGSITIQLAGVDSTNVSSLAVSFLQAGRTIPASIGTLTTSGGATQLSLTVPTGLVPGSIAASSAAPATITASVSSIAAPANLSFSVIPPLHAGAFSPSTVLKGVTVPVSMAGISTAFDSTNTIVSDDPQISFTGLTASSNTAVVATMTTGNGARVGSHIITLMGQGQSLTYSLQVQAGASAPSIGAVSPSAGAPAAPMTLTGSGFGSSSGSDVSLQYSYGGNQVQMPVIAKSDTEIDSFVPVLIDPSTGGLYTGAVLISVIVSGQPSNQFSFAMSALPANTSTVGTTTLAAIDAAIKSATTAQTSLANSTLMPSDQATSTSSVYTALLATLNTWRANVVGALAGNTVKNSDGSTLTSSTVDLLDRLLQSAGTNGGLSPAIVKGIGYRQQSSQPRPAQSQGQFLTTDVELAQAGQSCTSNDIRTQFNQYLDAATGLVCLSSLAVPAAAPVCGLLLDAASSSTVIATVAGTVCDAEPYTLATVTPSPFSITTYASGPAVVESPQGTFQSNPKLVQNAVVSLASLVLNELGGISGIDKVLINSGVSKQLVGQLGDVVEQDVPILIGDLVDDLAPSWGTLSSTTVPLTTATTNLIPDPNNLVGTSGLTVTPGSQSGQFYLTFDTSAFRMFDASNNITTYPSLVSGNDLPVVVGSVSVSVTPSSLIISPSSSQQFTAIVTGPPNNAVTWSVNGVVGGNSTVGAITSQGYYTAPASIPNPAMVTVTAMSQAVSNIIGSAQVTISIPSVTLNPSSATVQIGGSQQFSANVQGTANTAVSWAVNGIANGNSTVGTISGQGLYSAPLALPNPSTVTVSAASVASPSTLGDSLVTLTNSSAQGQPPSVKTYSATIGACDANGNTLVSLGGDVEGFINSVQSPPTTIFYQFGQTSSLGSSYANSANISQASNYVNLLGWFTPGVMYYYRAAATDPAGTGYGNILNFTAGCGASPQIKTEPATNVTSSSATLNADFNGNGQFIFSAPTSVWFQWGTDAGLGNDTAHNVELMESAWSADLGSIPSGTTIYYRAIAQDGNYATGYGLTYTFTTP